MKDRELYRAKSLATGEWIVSDSPYWVNNKLFLFDEDGNKIQCDPNTRAISFHDMVDKNGERIFAALNESGVGGSLCKICGNTSFVTIKNGSYCFGKKRRAWEIHDSYYAGVIGIYEA